MKRANVDRARSASEALVRYRPFFVDPAVRTLADETLGARYTRGLLGAKSPTNAMLLEALAHRVAHADALEAALGAAARQAMTAEVVRAALQ